MPPRPPRALAGNSASVERAPQSPQDKNLGEWEGHRSPQKEGEAKKVARKRDEAGRQAEASVAAKERAGAFALWRWTLTRDVDDYDERRDGTATRRPQPLRRLVLQAVAVHADLGTGVCNPTYAQIAALAGCSQSAAERHVQELVRRGLLTVEAQFAESGRQKANKFVVHFREQRRAVTGEGGASKEGEAVSTPNPSGASSYGLPKGSTTANPLEPPSNSSVSNYNETNHEDHPLTPFLAGPKREKVDRTNPFPLDLLPQEEGPKEDEDNANANLGSQSGGFTGRHPSGITDVMRARDILTEAACSWFFKAPIPSTDAEILAEAHRLVKRAEDAWDQGMRGSDIRTTLRLAHLDFDGSQVVWRREGR